MKTYANLNSIFISSQWFYSSRRYFTVGAGWTTGWFIRFQNFDNLQRKEQVTFTATRWRSSTRVMLCFNGMLASAFNTLIPLCRVHWNVIGNYQSMLEKSTLKLPVSNSFYTRYHLLIKSHFYWKLFYGSNQSSTNLRLKNKTRRRFLGNASHYRGKFKCRKK